MKHLIFRTFLFAFSISPTLGQEIERRDITELVREKFPIGSQGGLALLVVKDGEVIHSKGYGLANGKLPVTPQTRMPLASITKQFAAMCVAILIDEGKLKLTDPASRYLPHPKSPGRELLIQDLLWHISGLPNFIKAEERASIARYKEDHKIERLNNQTHAEWIATLPLKRKPGTEFEYTNSGYVLLARIVEIISNQSFHDFQKDRILKPLGMNNTTDSSRFNGSGNMSLSIEDYAKWDRALRDGRLLGPETFGLLFKRGYLDDAEPVDYGFGWRLEYDENENLNAAYHSGVGSPPRSARNYVIRDFENDMTVALFVRENESFSRSVRQSFAEEVRELVLSNHSEDPKSLSPIIDSDRLFHPAIGRKGIVSSQESMATAIGLKVLQDGGNAAEAAVAMAYTLCVTLPKAGNLGGGGFMLYYSAKDKQAFAIDFRETAPAAAHRDMYLDENNEVIKNLSKFGPKSIGVPGTVKGLSLVYSRFGGRLPLETLIEPAIRLAEDGIIVSPGLASDLENYQSDLADNPTIATVYYKQNGEPYQFGERLIQSDLAWSLKQIATHGEKAFYEGEIAGKLVDFMNRSGGLITRDDLRNYQAVIRKPVTGNYRGFEIISMPPPSSGGVHLIQMLNVLENTSLKEMDHNSARSIHFLTESMKYAYADRSSYLGDPDFVEVPVSWLTSKDYGKEIFQRIDAGKTKPASEIKPGSKPVEEGENTTHFSIMDQFGNAVAMTYTLNYSFGSRQMAPGTGILLNNEMDDFSAKPGVPNGYGLIGGDANAIAAQKRPLSSMTPTMVFKDGSPYLATGSPGGSKIITAVLQTILNVIEHDMNIAEASTAPRIHHQWLPDELKYEKGVSADTIRILQSYGHKTVPSPGLGSTQSVMKIGNRFEGYSDPRRPGAATLAY